MSSYWPIKTQSFPPHKDIKNRLISIENYGKMYESRLLGFKKVSKNLLTEYEE